MATYAHLVEVHKVGDPFPKWLDTAEAKKFVAPQMHSTPNGVSIIGFRTKNRTAVTGDFILQDFTSVPAASFDTTLQEEATIKTIATVNVLSYSRPEKGIKVDPYKITLTVPNAKSTIKATDFGLTDANATTITTGARVACYSNADFTTAAATTSLTAGTPATIYVKVTSYLETTIAYYKVVVTRAAS